MALARAAVLVLFVRALLAIVPFRTVLRWAGKRTSLPTPTSAREAELCRMIWAVDVVGRRLLPRRPCLTQAVIVHRLLLRSGRPAELRIGVRRGADRQLEAHAWVESGGAVVIGGKVLAEGYTPLPPLPVGSE